MSITNPLFKDFCEFFVMIVSQRPGEMLLDSFNRDNLQASLWEAGKVSIIHHLLSQLV